MFMGTLLNVFFRTLGFFLAILLFFLIILGISAYTNYQDGIEFDLVRGDIDSRNTIFILEINGPIIQSESSINDLVGMNIISPETVKNNLDKIGVYKVDINFHSEVKAQISIKINKIQSK